MEEIINELVETKWLDDNYKNSNYFREYLDKLNKDLKESTFN